jgi:ankyrin repeat protein
MELKQKMLEAVMQGDAAQVEACLAADRDTVEFFSSDGWTPLHLAAYFGHREAAECLLAHGANVEVRSNNDMRNLPHHAATANRQHALVELLLEHGADVNAVQSGGFTSLHEAALLGDEELVKLLLARGADKGLVNDAGQTALQIAEEKGHGAVAELLR